MTSGLIPPQPPKKPKENSVHGKTFVDDYFWMRDRENPEVIAHLKKENEHTRLFMQDTEACQEKLYQEILGRIKETDLSVPVRYNGYYYYSRTEKGRQYSIHCRKKGSLEAAEEILADCNELAQGHSYFRLGILKVSPDQNLMAYAVDTDGSETYTLRVKNLTTGEVLTDEIKNAAGSFEWASDNKTFFYSIQDEAKRPYKLFRHEIGSDPVNDALIFHEQDEAFFLSAYKTKDRRYIVLHLASKTTAECRFLPTDKPKGEFKIIEPRRKDMEYSVEHHNGKFLIVTNDNAVNFRLAEAPVERCSLKDWKDFIAHKAEVKIEGLDVFKDHLVVYQREQGLEKIRVIHLSSGQSHFIDFEDPVYSAWGGSNWDYDSRTLRFDYSSMVTPHTVYDYDLEKRTRELKKRQEVLGGYDPAQYASERIFAVSHDGVKVPISLVYKKGLKKDGSAPGFLYGYGSYGISMDPVFSSSRLSLLDRGFLFAMAHIRGGGDLGRPWYDDGKLLKKKNTFLDFVAAAEHLVKEKYTSADRLAIAGGSAGGLLMGAVTNLRPDLFKAVIAMVPFVDVLNTMMDPTLPLTVTEYEEWGNPQEKSYFESISEYSPYENVKPSKFPHMLITGGLNDPRVSYWEPAKWAARLRENNRGENVILLKMEMDSGHGGPSGRYDSLREIAFEYAFVLKMLGVACP